MTICSTLDPETFFQKFRKYEFDFLEVFRFFTEAYSEILLDRRPETFRITRDHARILRALAHGASHDDLTKLTFDSGDFQTVRKSLLETLQAKTLEQAAMIAVKINLLDSTPVDLNEVLLKPRKPLPFGDWPDPESADDGADNE